MTALPAKSRCCQCLVLAVRSLVVLVALGMLASCGSMRGAAGKPVPPAPPAPYTRVFRPDTNTVQLQIAVRRFAAPGRRAPELWLVGVSHIGDREYSRRLQDLLDERTIVLYEGVNAGAHQRLARRTAVAKRKDPDGEPASGIKSAAAPGIQSSMATSLGLVFQLETIDYERTNFINSDLSVGEIQALLAAGAKGAAGDPGGGASFQSLLQIMDGSSFLGGILQMGLRFIGASEKLQAITKLAFIETLGQLKGDLASAGGMPADLRQLMQVLIAARNRQVLQDFQVESGGLRRPDSVAIFYGTGHMDDMEQRITRELHYRPMGDIWLTAFSVDLKKTGLSTAELQLVRNLVQWQLSQMK